jgi:integrase
MQAIALWAKWAESGGLAPTPLKDYRREVVQFFGHAGVPWDRVTLTELTAYSASLAPSRTRIAYAALRNFWRWMRASGYDVVDPGFELMPYHKQRRKVPAAFSRDEVRRLVEAARRLSPKTEGIVVLLYTTGLRARELASVRPRDVTDDGLVVGDPKRKPGGQGARATRAADAGRGPSRRSAADPSWPPGSRYARRDRFMRRCGAG